MSMIRQISEMRAASDRFRLEGRRIALVPTMGALHGGHLALIRSAKGAADAVVTSVFVNPTQFGPAEDFRSYPRDIAKDLNLASAAGTDILFAPTTEEMYPHGYQTYIDVELLSRRLEGKSRPGHFRGVATVVVKLFQITKPHVAYFGQKDAQQVAVIRRMVRDLGFGVEIAVCPTVREEDGLAMSSRNVYLTDTERKEAPVLFRSLELAGARIRGGMMLSGRIIDEMKEMIGLESHGVIDYVSVADPETLDELEEIAEGQTVLVSLAVRFGRTRLIDNTVVTLGEKQ